MAHSPRKDDSSKAMMLGVGLDSDGHKESPRERTLRSWGSKETHEEMTEKAVKINEKLNERGKRLDNVSREEFNDIAHDVGLHRFDPEQN